MLTPTASGLTVAQEISGGMSGGFSGIDIEDPAENTEETMVPPAESDSVDDLINLEPSMWDPETEEPVDSITGSYLYKHDDLVTGGGHFPDALPFSRTYSSASGTYLTNPSADQGVGNAWAHTFDISTQVESDPYSGIGLVDTPVAHSATTIAALFVMQDLLSVTPTPQTMTLSTMVSQWLTDQLTNNVAIVTQPDTAEEFVALPHADGATNITYSPPPGSTDRLTQTASGQFTYKQKDGTTLNFGGSAPAGALQNWAFTNGVNVSLTYAGSLLSKVANNLGRSLTLTYSGADVSRVTDDTGRFVSYAYDAHHNLKQFSDPLGAKTVFSYDTSGTYDTLGHLTQVFYPAHPSNAFVTNWYDPMGRVAQQANANGYASNFYFASARTELIDPAGDRHVTYQTDRGKVLKDAWVMSPTFGDVFNDTQQQNLLINVTTNVYDGLDRLTSTTLPAGGTIVTSYATDQNTWANNVASVVRHPSTGSLLPPLTTSYLYDPTFNKPIQITDPLGLITVMVYDPATGNLLSSVSDAGGGGHFNATTRFTYDSLGHVLTQTDPLRVITQNTYDSFGNKTKVVADVAALQQTTLATFSGLGDVVAVTDANGNVSTSTYDADRRLTSSTTPGLPEAPAGRKTAYTYDADANLLQTQVSSSGTVLKTISTTYSLTGQPVTQTDANGNVTTSTYDSVDRLLSVTDPLRRVTSYGYDAMSRRIALYNTAIQAAPLQQWTYSIDGVLLDLTDANGNVTLIVPDGFDRPGTTDYPDTTTETLTYDADSNVLTRKTRRGDTITLTYDTLNRLSTKAAPLEFTATYAYDLDGRLIQASDNSTIIGMPSTGASYTTSYSYDAINRPLGVSWTPAPTQTLPTATSAGFTFGYDATNRLISQAANDNTWLSYPTTASNTVYTANELNQYSHVGGVAPTYDNNGNLTFDGTFTYAYDAENRLISIVQGSTTVATYAYDAQSRRKYKIVSGVVTNYVNDAESRELLEYAGGGGATQAWYAYGLGTDAVLNRMTGAGTSRQTLIPDRQGSIFATLDSGGVLTKAGYQTFGENPTATTGSFRYTAQRFDAETAGSVSQPSGLYYYRARMYSPTLARFLQSDPAGYPAGMNLYAYVLNDPMNLTDPTGMAPDEELDLEPKIEPQAGATGSGGGGYWLVGNIAAAAAGGSGGGGGGDDEAANDNGILSAGLGINAGEDEYGDVGEMGSSTDLFRAVNPAELEDITANGGAFRNPLGIENKYFSTTVEGAASYAQQTVGTGLYEGPYTIVQTSIPTNTIDLSMQATVDRGISTVTVPTGLLPSLSPASPLNFIPLTSGP